MSKSARVIASLIGAIGMVAATAAGALQTRLYTIDLENELEFGETRGPAGSVYYALGTHTAQSIPKIVKLKRDGTRENFNLPNFAQPVGLSVDANGNVWYASYSFGTIARLNVVSGVVVEFPLESGSFPIDTAVGGDGNIWVAQRGRKRITRVTLQGVLTHFPLPGGIRAERIVRGGDGNVWFVEGDAPYRIGTITPAGAVTLYTRPGSGHSSGWLSLCADGNLWYADGVTFGKVSTGGQITQHAYAGHQLYSIACAADGTLWAVESGGGTPHIARITPDGQVTTVAALDSGDASRYVTVASDGAVWISTHYFGDAADFAYRIAPAAETTPDTVVVEFYNSILNHHFITANLGEAAGIDAGAAGPGWSRTMQTFKAWVGGPIPMAPEVCRFYGTPGQGPNSHFYTAEFTECAAVKLDAGWTYEAPNKFWVLAPVQQGVCPAGSQPVYRAYNNRFAQNDSNHRYATNPVIYNQMLAMGYLGEGVVFCAPV